MTKLVSKKDFKDNCGFGLIANANGYRSHEILIKSIDALKSMTHRGAIGADGKTGDGCGILLDLDKTFFKNILLNEQKIKLENEFAIGQMFCSEKLEHFLPKIKKILKNENLTLKAIREVPIEISVLGEIAAKCLPKIYQLFI